MKSFTIKHVLIIFNPSSLIYYKKRVFSSVLLYLQYIYGQRHLLAIFQSSGEGGAGGGGGGIIGICGRNKVSQTFESIFEKSVKQSEFEHWSFVVRGRYSTHQAITTMATNENFPPYSNAILCLEGSL